MIIAEDAEIGNGSLSSDLLPDGSVNYSSGKIT
jgi:hypothetical protein